jgi:hypothetical protein
VWLLLYCYLNLYSLRPSVQCAHRASASHLCGHYLPCSRDRLVGAYEMIFQVDRFSLLGVYCRKMMFPALRFIRLHRLRQLHCTHIHLNGITAFLMVCTWLMFLFRFERAIYLIVWKLGSMKMK